MDFVNLTPHPVTIIRVNGSQLREDIRKVWAK